MAQPEDQADEILLLTYTHLSGYNLEQLAVVLSMMVETIDGKICSIDSIRIDEVEHKIYGRVTEIQTYEEFK